MYPLQDVCVCVSIKENHVSIYTQVLDVSTQYRAGTHVHKYYRFSVHVYPLQDVCARVSIKKSLFFIQILHNIMLHGRVLYVHMHKHMSILCVHM